MRALKSKVLTLLGFASRAGALCYGFAATVAAIKAGKAKGVFFAVDISAKSRKEVMFYCDKFGVGAYELRGINMEELSHAVGRKCAVAAVKDDSFTNSVISNLTLDG